MATAPSLSPRMMRVLAHDGPFYGRPRPTADELVAIRAVLAEGVPAAARLDLARAIFIVADNQPDAEAAALIADILHDPAATPSLRAQAAASLGDIDAPVARRALAEALARAPVDLEPTLLLALAKHGDDASADTIARLPPPADGAPTEQLRRVTRALIAYRSGATPQPDAEAALWPPFEPAGEAGGRTMAADAVPVQMLAAAEVEPLLARLQGSTYGVRVGAQTAPGYDCGGRRHIVLLADDLRQARSGLAWTAARRIAGLVIAQIERDAPDTVVRRLIVTRPLRGMVDIALLCRHGATDLRGQLTPTRDGATMVLASPTGAPRAVDVEARLAAGAWALQIRQRAMPGVRRSRQSVPEPDAVG